MYHCTCTPVRGNRLFPFSHMTETEKEHYYGTLRPVKECMKQDVTKRLQTQQQKGGRTDQK